MIPILEYNFPYQYISTIFMGSTIDVAPLLLTETADIHSYNANILVINIP